MDVDHAGTGGGVGTLASARTLAAREPGTGLRPWLDRRHLIIAYALFLAYAAIDAIGSAGEDRVWAIWAACGYAVALLILWRWGSRIAAALVSVALAVVAPLLWLSVAYRLEDGMGVIERSASLLLHHGSPYLTADQVTSWLSYNPYLPVMTLFGLPHAAGVGGLAGNAGVWLALGTVAVLAVAFRIAMPVSRRDALLATAVAVASPVIGLNLAVITTDPPVLAFILLALALSAVPAGAKATAARTAGAGIALGVACDLKSTAWLAVPVMAAMFAARDGARAAYRFLAAVVVTVLALIALLAPAVLFKRSAATALVQNSVLFPLGLTRVQDAGREPAARAPALLDGNRRARGLGRPAARGRPGRRGLAGHPAAARRARGDLAAGHRPDADVPARAERPLRLLHLPVRPARLAGPDPGHRAAPRRQCSTSPATRSSRRVRTAAQAAGPAGSGAPQAARSHQ